MRIIASYAALLALLALSWSCGLAARRTGFLTDYSGLEEVASDVWFYVNDRVPVGTYSRFIVDPVESYIDLEESGFREEEVTEFAEYMHATIVRRLSVRYDVVTLPGAGVARISIALTSISGSVPLLNIIPHTRVLGAGRGGAAMEAEIRDSLSGEQVAAIVQSGSAGVFESAGLSDASDIHAVIDYWADQLGEHLREHRFGEGTER